MQIEIEFKVEHTPGDWEHHNQILENYFRAKGVDYKDGKITVWVHH